MAKNSDVVKNEVVTNEPLKDASLKVTPDAELVNPNVPEPPDVPEANVESKRKSLKSRNSEDTFVTTAPEKLVKVRGLVEETSNIAGIVYHIKPKEVIEVPAHVCAIWQNANVAVKL